MDEVSTREFFNNLIAFQSYSVNGKYTIKTAIDDSHVCTTTLFNFLGGQYKKFFEKSSKNLCQTMYNETNRPRFENFQSHQKFPVEWKTCPYPTGPNEIYDFTFEDFASSIPPFIPGGKWKLEIRFFKDGAVLGGYNFYLLLRNDERASDPTSKIGNSDLEPRRADLKPKISFLEVGILRVPYLKIL